MFFSKKGAGDAVSTLILFIAVVGISVGIVVAMKNYAIETHESLKIRNEIVNYQLKTSIDITNMYYNTTTNQVVIYVKNIGETKLVTQDFDLFVNNRFSTNFTAFEAGDISSVLDILLIKQTAMFYVNQTLSSGSHEVKVVSGYGGSGDTDYFNT